MNRNQDPVKHTLEEIKKIEPCMRYRGGDFAEWQKKSRMQLAELLGLPFVQCEDLFTVEYDTQCESYREIRFTFQSEEGYFVPCHLLIPHGAEEPPPVVICLQGHSTGMHISLGRPKFEGDAETISGGDRDFAVGALQKGFCALTVEQRGMGECGGTPEGPACHVHTMANLLIGRTTIGERVWDISRAIDMLEQHFAKEVDRDNIICLGNSGGGTTTFYAACMDERIRTAIPSCCYASYDDSIAAMFHCTCNFIPQIRKYFDMGDLGGLIAPRTLILVSGEKDTIFPIDSAQACFAVTKSLYGHTNGACRHVIGPEGHRFYYDLAWKMYDDLQGES